MGHCNKNYRLGFYSPSQIRGELAAVIILIYTLIMIGPIMGRADTDPWPPSLMSQEDTLRHLGSGVSMLELKWVIYRFEDRL